MALARGLRSDESNADWVLEQRVQRGFALSELCSPPADDRDVVTTKKSFS
jgi:hypothetical protein